MQRRITGALLLACAVILAWLLVSRGWHPPPSQATSAASPTKSSTGVSNGTPPTHVEQVDVTSLTREQLEAEVRSRDAKDKQWEWRTPIRFYGKVIDQDGKAVRGADVHFQWTDLSAKGSEEAETKSDEHGLFSLEGVKGKRLLVRVTDPGYYSSDARNSLSFEFANPFEEIFYQPNPKTPVIFHLRKRDPTADVFQRSVELILPGEGAPTRIHLETGKTRPNGELQLQAWKPWPPPPMSPPYDWKVLLILEGGGFTEAPSEFAFEAPEGDYVEQFSIDMSARFPSAWKVSAERSLYFVFGNPKKYGHLTLRTDGNSRYIFLEYAINSSGSRKLETGTGVR
jgi:hypothetical protein